MGTMASFITKTYIKDIALLKNGKKRPSSKGTIPVFGGNGIMDYVNQHNDENAVIVGRVGAYCGCVYLCESKCWISDNAISAKAKEGTDNRFLYYLLKNLDLNHHHIGGAQPLMTQDIIGRIEVNVPSFDVQKRLADILSSLDAKIENNNKINAKLEEMAQALFKSWFIDFEPFKVGRDGSRPAFGSGNFVESELGMIPEELAISKIREINHTLETGRRPKGGAVAEGIPSVGAEHVKGMGNYDYSSTKYIDKEFASKLKTGKINGYELLIYKDGGKPGYFIPNYAIFGEGYPFEECYLNEHVFKLDFERNKEFNAFAYFFFHTDYVFHYLNAQGGKAAIPGINKNDVESLYIFSPENEKVIEFGKLVLPMITKMLRNSIENRTLAQTRDTLLPKLMSGEIEL